jgi:hypothetical protein
MCEVEDDVEQMNGEEMRDTQMYRRISSPRAECYAVVRPLAGEQVSHARL